MFLKAPRERRLWQGAMAKVYPRYSEPEQHSQGWREPVRLEHLLMDGSLSRVEYPREEQRRARRDVLDQKEERPVDNERCGRIHRQ